MKGGVTMTSQEKEIQTIKERTIKLNLSDADVKRLFLKAGASGLTVNELLENFIGDLVNGTYSNGSDERDLANQWFNRCWFSLYPDKTFLRYLIEYDELDRVYELWNDIQDCKEELLYSETHNEKFTTEEIEEIQNDLEIYKAELNVIFEDFKKWAKDEETGTLEHEVKKIINFIDSMDLQD